MHASPSITILVTIVMRSCIMCLLQWDDTVLHTACHYGYSTAVAVILTSKISADVRNSVS